MTDIALTQALVDNPTAALEDIARAAGCTPLEVLEALPESEVTHLPGTTMPDTLDDISTWGEITFIVNTGPVVLEVKSEMGKGALSGEMYNLNTKPICGHLNARACARVAFVRRKLFSMETRSVQFYAKDGSCMFKVYLGRDEKRQLIASQMEAFDALETRLLHGKGA